MSLTVVCTFFFLSQKFDCPLHLLNVVCFRFNLAEIGVECIFDLIYSINN